MSIERALFQRLTVSAPDLAALVGTRIYPTVAPIDVPRPYVIFQRISAQRVRSFRGPSGLTMARFQLDAYAATYLASRSVADALRRRLDGWSGTETGTGWSCRVNAASLLSDGDLYEPEAEPPLFRATLDFMLTFEEI